jgi:hypothetical protein
MDEAQFEAKYKELQQYVTEMVDLLHQAGQDFWARWFEKSKTLLEGQYPNSLGHVLQPYGGAGSFNDVSLEEPLKTLSRRCYTLARELLDDVPRSPDH